MKVIVLILFIVSQSLMTHWQSGIYVNQFYSSKRMMILEVQKHRNLGAKPVQILKITAVLVSLVVAVFNTWYAIIWLLTTIAVLSYFAPRIKQRITKRKGRLLATSLTFIVAFAIMIFFINQTLFLGICIFLSYFSFLIISLSNIMMFPIESLIKKYYLKKVRRKICSNQKLKIVAITGSYGKTSFKRYLYTLLSKKHLTLRSPGSVNTVMGLTKFINSELSPYDEFLILEFGVDSKGGMDKLLKFISPNYGVITAIGPMHLATFKNLSNIQNEKLKLAGGLKKEKVLFYNADSVKLPDDKKLICESFSYSLSEISILDVSISGATIALDGKEYLIPLLGKHQILNCWGAIKMAMHLGMNYEEITRALVYISPEEHRLSIERHSNRIIIDDSYNSNQEGMEEAIIATLQLPGKKAIITPGIIEVGNMSNTINTGIGEKLISFDKIYIVSNEKEPALLRGYLKAGGSQKNIIVFSSFIEAYRASKKAIIDVLLISNDAHKIHIK